MLDAWSLLRHEPRPGLIEGLSKLVLGETCGRRGWDDAVAAFLTVAHNAGRGEVLAGCTECECEIELQLPIVALLAQHHDAGEWTNPLISITDVVGLSRLPAEEARDAAAAWDESLDEERPLLSPVVTTSCPQCDAVTEVGIDAVALAWSAIDELAQRVVEDVTLFAGAFGWTESDVLDVPPQRRRIYRELVDARG